jgi:glycosyltransferase involved in cell wall biosynthesis
LNLIFICAAGIVSGKEQQTLETMIQLKKRGHQVFCITSSWGTPEFVNMLKAEFIPFERLRIGFISKSLTYAAIRMTLHQLMHIPFLWWNYRRLIRVQKPDVVIHTNFHHLFLLLPVRILSRQVFLVHDYFAPTPFYRKLFRLFIGHVWKFVAVSKFIARNLRQLEVPESQVAVVYNGVSRWNKEMEYRNCENNKIRIGIVGQIGRWKGHLILIEALSKILQQEKAVELHVIGQGEASFINELNRVILNHKIQSHVVFRGRVNSLQEIYGGIDIVCVPSMFEESFGLVAVEPGFFKIPVICSDKGALNEVILDQVTGLVIPAGNVDALTVALLGLIKNPSLRKQMGEAAFYHVSEFFTADKNSAQLERLFLES